MTRLRQHYVIESQIGCAKVRIYALRCETCQHDFHIDELPEFCPCCGSEVGAIYPFVAESIPDNLIARPLVVTTTLTPQLGRYAR